MKRFFGLLGKLLLAVYLLAIHLLAGLYLYQYFLRQPASEIEITQETLKDPTETTPLPTVQPVPSIEPSIDINANQTTNEEQAQNSNQTQNTNQSVNAIQAANNSASDAPATVLMIPVVGIKREQLQDTFSAARSEGRVHNATDIMAPVGTPVVAAADGEIAKFFLSERGGITIYQFSADHHFIYYYAHLQKRAENLNEKDFVKRGTVIGFVGDTGDAGAGNYHLHFSISIATDPKRYWGGTDINPYPLLKEGIEAH